MKFLLNAFLLPLLLHAQVLRRPMAAPYTGTGAYSYRHTDVFSFSSNQASLAQLKSNAVGLYGERKFMLSELNSYSAVAAVKTGSGNIGLNANYSGYARFNESKIGLAYGRKLGSKLDIGAQINYHSVRFAGDYGKATAIGFETGIIFHVNERIHTGLHISNPIGGRFGNGKEEKISALYSFGIGYDASEKLLISLVIEKEEDQPVNVNAGIQYKPVPLLMVRTGMASATSSVWAGAGLQLRSFRLDLTATVHPQLGLTPGLLLLFHFKNKEQ